MQKPENFLGTWYQDDNVHEYDRFLWARAWELKTQEAKNEAYDFTAKRFGSKCTACQHFYETVSGWGKKCWTCCEKEKGTILEEGDLEWVNEKYGCVCCREMKWNLN